MGGPREAAGRLPQDQDVRGLEVAVDDPALVGVGDGLADLPEKPQAIRKLGRGPLAPPRPTIPRVERTALATPLGRAAVEVLAERFSPHQLHREEGESLGRRPRLVDRGDAGMLESGEGLHLPLEHPQREGVGVKAGPDDLQGDGSMGMELLGLVDDPHAPLAELARDAEARQGGRGWARAVECLGLRLRHRA